MAKIAVLHVVWLGLVTSLTLQREHRAWEKTDTEIPAYQGQALEREVPEESLEKYVQGNFTVLPEAVALDGVPDLPKSIQGRNLIFAGDHVDRDAVKHICARYKAKMTSFSDLRATDSVAGRKFAHAPAKGSSSNHLLCHLDSDMNVSIMYLWHPGVMSVPPLSAWHQEQLKTTWKSYLYTTKVNGKTMWVDQAQDLAKVYWRKAIYDHLPNRPTVVVTQSSVWDSLLAIGFLDSIKPARSLTLFQEGLEDMGWGSYDGLDAWNWTEHATSYVGAVKHGLSPEKLVWRTNVNCLDEKDRKSNFVKEVSDEQAEVVKYQIQHANAVAGENAGQGVPDGPWTGVKIMDWREVYVLGDGCDPTGKAFNPNGYESYMQTLWYTLDDSGHEIDL